MKEIQMWRHDRDNCQITDGSNKIVDTADIPILIADEIYKLHNEGAGVEELQKYLDKKSPLSTEEVDSVIEQIRKWEYYVKPAENPGGGIGDVIEDPADAEWIERTDEEIEEDNREPDIRPTVMQEVVQQYIVEQVSKTEYMNTTLDEETGKPVPVAEKKTRIRTSLQKAVGGKVGAQTLILLYKEKAEALGYIDMVEIDDLPTTSIATKGVRDVLIQLQKDIEMAKNNAVQSIQKL